MRKRRLAWGLTAMLVAGCGAGVAARGPIEQPAAAPGAATSATQLLWGTYHRTLDRAGDGLDVPTAGTVKVLWHKALDGAVYAEPLLVAGLVIAATENDSVYGLNPSTGAIKWRRHLATPMPQSQLPCGDIDPSGITGTPLYDARTGNLFVVTESSPGAHHTLYALNPSTGTVRWHRGVDIPYSTPTVEQQRGALAVSDGRVYVPFGGRYGDCGPYHGEVVSVPTNNLGTTEWFRVPTQREGGIWAASGPAVNTSTHDLYVSVGNGAATSPPYDDSDSVLQLSAALHQLSRFYPSDWAAENANDEDLGSMGPLLLPYGHVFADGKAGNAYLLAGSNLGGVGHYQSTLSGCAAYGGAARDKEKLFVPCDGGLRELLVSGTTIKWGWQQSATNGSPVVGGGMVWTLSGGRLYALHESSGTVYTSVSVGTTSHFATPTLVQSRAYVGTLTGVSAITGA